MILISTPYKWLLAGEDRPAPERRSLDLGILCPPTLATLRAESAFGAELSQAGR